jgi:hypothetical protein
VPLRVGLYTTTPRLIGCGVSVSIPHAAQLAAFCSFLPKQKETLFAQYLFSSLIFLYPEIIYKSE